MKMAILGSILVFSFSTFAHAYTLTCSNSSTDFITVDEKAGTATMKSASGERNMTVIGFEDFYIDPADSSRFNIRADNNMYDLFKPVEKVGRWHTYYEFAKESRFFLVVDRYDNGKHVAALSTGTTDDGKILHTYQSCQGK